MKPRFYLSSKLNSDGRAAIILFISTHGKRITISTGKIIKPQNWNSNKQCAKGNSPEVYEMNKFLINFGTKAVNTLTHLVENNASDIVNSFKKELNKSELKSYTQIQNDIAGSNGTFLDFLYNQSLHAHKAKATLKQYKNLHRILSNFQKDCFKKRLDFETIDFVFHEIFLRYCENLNYAANSIGGFIKKIKTNMEDSRALEMHDSVKYKNKRFYIPEEESSSIHLSEDELQKLSEFPLHDNIKLEKVRDLFIADCWIGVRISDLFVIEPGHISKKTIKIRVKKTNEFVELPILPQLKTILNKYNGVVSNQQCTTFG